MRERLITLACALAALALFLELLVGGGARRHSLERPNTEEHGARGLYAAHRWLQAEHVRVASLREGYTRLAAAGGTAARGNLLVVSLPAASRPREAELHALDEWVRAGNTLLVLAAVLDRPGWAGAAGGTSVAELGAVTGIDWNATPAAIPGTPRNPRLVPQIASGLFAGVRAVGAGAEGPSAWRVHPAPARLTLALAREPDTAHSPPAGSHDAFWIAAAGRGEVLVSACATLFDNGALGDAQNARLLANIVAQSLGPGGVVIFDDAHQGLQAAYDPERFYRDPRLYRTIAVLVLLWFAWAAGAAPLRLARPQGSRGPEAGELARATAGLLARVTPADAAARRLFELFFAELGERCGRTRLETEAAWELLAHARVPGDTLARVRRWYALAHASRPLPLAALQEDLQTLRAALTRP